MYTKSLSAMCLLAISTSALPQGIPSVNSLGVTGTSPAGNGLSNVVGKNLVDGLVNNGEVLNGAGIANAAANGATVLNGNVIKPSVITAGNANNDRNGALAVDAVAARANVDNVASTTSIETPVANVPVPAVPAVVPAVAAAPAVAAVPAAVPAMAAVPAVVESVASAANLDDKHYTRRQRQREGVIEKAFGTVFGEDKTRTTRQENTIKVLPKIGTAAIPAVAPAAAPIAAPAAGPNFSATAAKGFSPGTNGIGNSDGKSGVDGLVNNPNVLLGAGIANGAANGVTGLNNNLVDPTGITLGDANNDGNAASRTQL